MPAKHSVKAKVPKARVVYIVPNGHISTVLFADLKPERCALIPFGKEKGSQKQARAAVKVHNMTHEERVELVAMAIDPAAKSMKKHYQKLMAAGSTEPWYDYWSEAKAKASAVLSALQFPASGRNEG